MKKRIQSAAVTLLSVLLLCYVFFTPVGALRLSVFCHGYPIEAVTLRTREATVQDTGAVMNNPAHSTVYTITEHIPYEVPTGGELRNWIVYRFFVFHIMGYYGYG